MDWLQRRQQLEQEQQTREGLAVLMQLNDKLKLTADAALKEREARMQTRTAHRIYGLQVNVLTAAPRVR